MTDASHAPKSRFTSTALIPPAIFALLTVIVLSSGLFAPPHRVLGSNGGDLTMQFISWREFGFSHLARGEIPLWNQHVFGGTPYLAGFQSALFYPPNWLHLIFSLARAINWIIALHVFAAGYFTYLWCRRHASMVGAMIGGAMFMLGAPFFLHIFPGHLPHVAVIVWIPLILLAIDKIVEDARSTSGWLLGSFAIAMQVLAGHPQYVYYTAIIAGLYFLTRAIVQRNIVAKSGWFVAMYAMAAALSAIQLLPGIAVTSQMVRSSGLSYGMAGTFSLPPENLLTAVAPNIFGPLELAERDSEPGEGYIGRGYLWEMSLFAGVGGLILALIGAISTADKRLRWIWLAMIAICLLLALGRHTPIYWLLYRFVPKYNSFRGTVKFAAIGAAFVSMLAATGFDRVRDLRTNLSATIAITLAALILITALSINFWWPNVLQTMAMARTDTDARELFTDLPTAQYTDADFIKTTSISARNRLLISAGVAALFAAVTAMKRFDRRVVYLLPVILAAELIVFARASIKTTNDIIQFPQTWKDAIAQDLQANPNARVLVIPVPYQNAGMSTQSMFDNIWGYDPGVLKRYAELVTFSQGESPDTAKQYLNFQHPDENIFRALRCNLVLLSEPNPRAVPLGFSPLPPVQLIRKFQVIPKRDELFATLASNSFEPAATVLLESQPVIVPVLGSSIGDAQVIRQTTDWLELRVDIETSAILHITNNFTPDWRVVSLDASPVQSQYTIQPANWTQQAIALTAGKHHFRVEYAPLSYRVGRWISLISLLGFAFLSLRFARQSN